MMKSQAEVAFDKAVGTQLARLHTPEARRKSGRSRIANGGGSMLPTTDGRSLWARNPPGHLSGHRRALWR